VLDDVAVPDEQPGDVEAGLHPGHLTRVGDHGVLEAVLARVRPARGTVERTPGSASTTSRLDAIFPVGPRVDGVMFDGYIGNRDINNGYPLETITAPTLFVHFKDDGGPPYDAAVVMCRRIPGARMLVGEHGGHLGLGEHPGITAGIKEFLQEVEAGAAGQPSMR